MVLIHAVEQADDLTGRPGVWVDDRLRDEHRLTREAPDLGESFREYVGEGVPGTQVPVDPDPVHVGRAWPPRLRICANMRRVPRPCHISYVLVREDVVDSPPGRHELRGRRVSAAPPAPRSVHLVA